jgi:hypothetical protein
MHENCGDRPLLGSVLVTHGVVESGELDEALLDQAESGKQLGEILVDRGVICRPELDRAFAVARSGAPSPFRSPIATEKGSRPVA